MIASDSHLDITISEHQYLLFLHFFFTFLHLFHLFPKE